MRDTEEGIFPAVDDESRSGEHFGAKTFAETDAAGQLHVLHNIMEINANVTDRPRPLECTSLGALRENYADARGTVCEHRDVQLLRATTKDCFGVSGATQP